jgi:hypothetical protein
MPVPVKPNTVPNPWDAPEGPDIAPHAPEQAPGQSVLPPGAHPNDPSVAGGLYHGDNPVPQDQAYGLGQAPTGRPPWSTDNDEALGVFQRGSDSWDGGLIVVDANGSGTAQVIGRQKGRCAVKLWVPTALNGVATVYGVMLSPNQSELENPIPGGFQLNPGDSIVIETEAPVYAGLIGTNPLGHVQWIVLSNPLGGHLAGL